MNGINVTYDNNYLAYDILTITLFDILNFLFNCLFKFNIYEKLDNINIKYDDNYITFYDNDGVGTIPTCSEKKEHQSGVLCDHGQLFFKESYPL